MSGACFSCGHVHRDAHLLEIDLATARAALEEAQAKITAARNQTAESIETETRHEGRHDALTYLREIAAILEGEK